MADCGEFRFQPDAADLRGMHLADGQAFNPLYEASATTAATRLTRRGFLGLGAALLGNTVIGADHLPTQSVQLRLPPGRPASRVVRVQNPRVIEGGRLHRPLLKEMLDAALISLTGEPSSSAAWRRILRSDDVVGLKFNRSGQQSIGTTPVVAQTLVDSLVQAGWEPSRIVCIEAPPGADSALGTKPADSGFGGAIVNFGSGADQFSRVLSQITALISVPYLKTHNITGLTCSLKNLSHGLIKHPGRYHRNGCDPYIADIVAAPIIRQKLRLFLVDALRVVYEGGPAATNATLSDEGIVLASFDPVAIDLVGLTILNELRAKRGLDSVADSTGGLPYLATAHLTGLGVAVWHGIDLLRVKL